MNEFGFVDYENLYGIEGVGLANVVSNAEEVEGRNAPKQLQTRITFDDGEYSSLFSQYAAIHLSHTGRTWSSLTPPEYDSDNRRIPCNSDECFLHLHSDVL